MAPESDLLADVLANPYTLPAAGALLIGLLGFGAYRLRQRKQIESGDSSYLESKLHPDSFFGAGGGQNIDTSEAVATGSSMMYSPSQLDAGGDVDPVAEADVYLAYGRDLQAEEILKEALRINPKRVAIHAKMLEIYAKRRDIKAFEVVATEMYALTAGNGPEWGQACAMGQELDPPNPLYQPGGKPVPIEGAPTDFAGDTPMGMVNTQPFMPSQVENTELSASANNALDLDLDFSTADAPPIETVEPTEPPAEAAPPAAQTADAPLEFTLDGDIDQTTASPVPEPIAPPAFELSAADLSFDMPADEPPPPVAEPMPDAFANADTLKFDMDLSLEPGADQQTMRLSPPTPQPPASPDAQDNSLMSFDMADLSLDMPGIESVSPLEDIPEGDPLETKLSLAAEFMAIGDMEGARSLAEEVVEQASGRLKEKARAFLTDLG